MPARQSAGDGGEAAYSSQLLPHSTRRLLKFMLRFRVPKTGWVLKITAIGYPMIAYTTTERNQAHETVPWKNPALDFSAGGGGGCPRKKRGLIYPTVIFWFKGQSGGAARVGGF